MFRKFSLHNKTLRKATKCQLASLFFYETSFSFLFNIMSIVFKENERIKKLHLIMRDLQRSI